MRSLRLQLLATLIVTGCLTPAIADAPRELAEVTFEQHEIALGSAHHQTVLTGFFLGGAMADLAVVSVDESGDRRLRIHTFEGGSWAPKLDEALRSEVLFVDVANIGGRDRLITYERGRLSWFDPESATEHTLVEVSTSYNATDTREIPHVDITRDLNRDGFDDVVVPDLDGFWISTQSSNGSFTDAVKLGPPEPYLDEIGLEEKRRYGDVGITALTVPWYLSRVHEMDYDQDGRSDLVFWNEDHFDVHHQDGRGSFEAVAETFTTDVPFDSDGTYSLMFGFSDEGTFSLLFGFRKKTKRTVLHSLRDMTGDGVADLVTQSLEGRSLLKQRSVYEVHLGRATPDGTVFARDVSTSIQPQGNPGQPVGYASQSVQDFDGDGQVDIMLQVVKTGFGGMIRALAAKSIALDLEFYRIEDGTYPDKPNATRKVKPGLHPFGRRGFFFPTVLLGDVNGDGRADLLAGKDWEELHVFFGVPGPDLFTRRPQEVAVALPANERNARLVDLNEDGKQDLLVHHPSTTEPHRVTMLIAR